MSKMKLERTVGSGASGVVWQGVYAGTPVAVKVLHTHLVSGEIVAKLRQEVELCMQLQLRHPHVVQVTPSRHAPSAPSQPTRRLLPPPRAAPRATSHRVLRRSSAHGVARALGLQTLGLAANADGSSYGMATELLDLNLAQYLQQRSGPPAARWDGALLQARAPHARASRRPRILAPRFPEPAPSSLPRLRTDGRSRRTWPRGWPTCTTAA